MSDAVVRPTTDKGRNLYDNRSFDHEGEMRRLDWEQPFLPAFHRKRADPAPLGFMALGSGLFLVSIIAMGTDNLTTLNMIVATMLGYCSIAELVAGIWEFPTGNTYGAAFFLSLSGLFASTALVLSPWSDILSSYTSTAEFYHAASMNFFSWFIVLTLFTIAAHRSSGGLLCCLTFVDLFLLMLSIYFYTLNHGVLIASGAFGIIASFVAWYAALSTLLTESSSSFRLPVLLDLTKGEKAQ
jgi:succinate-acetate transporter protein